MIDVIAFSGDVVFTDHYMRRLAQRYGGKPKRKQRTAAARALLLGLTGVMTPRSHFVAMPADGRMLWRLDVGGRSTDSVVVVRGSRAELVTALPRAAYGLGARQ